MKLEQTIPTQSTGKLVELPEQLEPIKTQSVATKKKELTPDDMKTVMRIPY